MSYKIRVKTKNKGWWWDRKQVTKYHVVLEIDTYFSDCGYINIGSTEKLAEFDTLEEADNYLNMVLNLKQVRRNK